MTPQDRELLELAARAVGIVTYRSDTGLLTRDGAAWNPLTDDGDALRLAVKLGIFVKIFPPIDDDSEHYTGFVEAWRVDEEDPLWVEHEVSARDVLCATRLAIVRAAAAIGRAME